MNQSVYESIVIALLNKHCATPGDFHEDKAFCSINKTVWFQVVTFMHMQLSMIPGTKKQRQSLYATLYILPA